MPHLHKSISRRVNAFSGPVWTKQPNPSAHGNISILNICSCGATRKSNHNGQHSEYGPWITPESAVGNIK